MMLERLRFGALGLAVAVACSGRPNVSSSGDEAPCQILRGAPSETIDDELLHAVVWLVTEPKTEDPLVVNWRAQRIAGQDGRVVTLEGTPWLVTEEHALSLAGVDAGRVEGRWIRCGDTLSTASDYVSSPLAPTFAEAVGGLVEVARYPDEPSHWPLERTSDVAIVNSELLAIARGPDGLRILQRDDSRERIVEVAHVAVPVGDDFNDVVAIDERYVAVASRSRGLVIVDLDKPDRPVIAADSLPWISPRDGHSVFVQGQQLFLARAGAVGTGAVVAFDVSEPEQPRELWRWTADAGQDAHDVAVRGNRAYVSSIRGGITVLEWEGDGAPVVVGRHAALAAHSCSYIGDGVTERWLWGEERLGGTLQLVDLEQRGNEVVFRVAPQPSVFDVGTAALEPLRLRSAASPHQSECLGSLCFLAHYQLGLRVVDMAEVSVDGGLRPSQDLRASYATWQPSAQSETFWFRGAMGVALELPWIYVADTDSGLVVLHYAPESESEQHQAE